MQYYNINVQYYHIPRDLQLGDTEVIISLNNS